jgi:hypothetical protein
MTGLSGICHSIKSFTYQFHRNFLLENLILAQLGKNFPASCKTDLYFRVHSIRQTSANFR